MSSTPPPAPSSFSRGERWKSRASTAIGVALAVYILYLANGIVYRHPQRLDLTAEGLLTLSPAALNKLRFLNEEIQIVIPTLLLKDNPEHVAYHGILSRARLLLTEINAVNPLVRLPIEVDVITQPERWEQIRTGFKLEASQVNRLLFFAGPQRDRRQTVTMQNLATLGPVPDPAVNVPEVASFRGESALMDALGRLLSVETRKVYFTQDKGELPLSQQADAPPTLAGVWGWARDLEADGLKGEALRLSAVREIPLDCALLVIAGSWKPYGQDELRVLDAYLRRGGRLLVALGAARTGLEDLLAEWGVTIPRGTVLSQRIIPNLSRTFSHVIFAPIFSTSHAVTRDFSSVQRFEAQLEFARPLTAGGRGKGLEVTPLVSVASSETAPFYLVSEPSGPLVSPEPGNYDVVVAVEQHVPDRPPPEFQRLQTRIVVAGSASMVGNKYFLRGSNRDLARNAVVWLLGDDARTSAGSVEWTRRTLKMSPAIERYLFWVPIVILPGVFLVAGFLVYFARRT